MGEWYVRLKVKLKIEIDKKMLRVDWMKVSWDLYDENNGWFEIDMKMLRVDLKMVNFDMKNIMFDFKISKCWFEDIKCWYKDNGIR